MCNLGDSRVVNFVGKPYLKLYVPMNARQTTKSLYILMQQTDIREITNLQILDNSTNLGPYEWIYQHVL